MSTPTKLLIAASGTGGHLFPALAVAEQLSDYQIEWLGVPNRLETQLVPSAYPLHAIAVEGFQQRLGLGTFKIVTQLVGAIFQVRKLLKQGNFQGVFTTGGYISAPAVLAARSLGLPIIFHESNALPGKVTRTFSRFCSVVAIGFEAAAKYLPGVKTIYTGTPVRSQFRSSNVPLELPIPANVPLIVVFGGSQGAVAVNKLVRECVPSWCDAGAWVVHLTGDKDPDAGSLQQEQYLTLPFYDNMAGLLNRANLAISRAGAASLTELAVTGTPAILIPYPFAAEDHQAYNAEVFTSAGAALAFKQSELTKPLLESKVLSLLNSPQLEEMAKKAKEIAVVDSAEQLAALIRKLIERR
ncbi:undecaprenyldiphospho-muramoylpentapeptide beta-N-acetylglucosaminyltransferase [Aliterella atlantica]|uniref:UDP-N-acetylglucosamine--N-acetylmuramyl-(pentapeptide) pyrophosphoryl-undecaprenol N-acetylglucosamine transferase n=1 Tax=Aliterella atlantica CENA595 TaxID=1618023 RepID=A0A0D8ZWA0_9CYAN|nr:undecaprenyldiphospho-muramoylpentapeptide beta-N-acetylglucosaminyltransferase [Aliterella atlantica]KJH73058.1 UDP-N-acetylglucosamine--N-acetylmuramyl-(pentapeptide) pyrophosphoryl-UDP N-acetylglucosamine transferase [Aliterella atlantica CENA595]